MVRRLIAAMCLLVAVCASMATQAMAYTVYDGNLSATYVDYFRDILTKFSATTDYVVFRSGQYEYMLVLGSLHLTDTRIQSDGSIDICVITTNSGYNSSYSISFRSESGFDLECNDEIVYSNLGLYPSLFERGDVNDYATLLIIVSCAVCCIFRGIFEWRHGIRCGN